MSAIKDGLGFEEVTVDADLLTSTQNGFFQTISGANAAITGSIVVPTVNCTTTQSAYIYGNTLISGATLKGDYISGTAIRVGNEGILHSVSIGSNTAVYGAKIQAGSGTLSAGSDYWITYPVAYLGKPSIQVTNTTSADKAIAVIIGSLTLGSAYVAGEAAADTFSWLSVGI